MHVNDILSIEDLPQECINDCSAQGAVDDAVEYWRETLDFTVNPDKARDYLRGYGAWDDDELADDEQNARRVLWLACCSFAEYQHEIAEGRADDPHCGSDIFVLER